MRRAKVPPVGFKKSPDADHAAEWEVRPGGMLVQKRIPGSDTAASAAAATIRVKVKYGSAYHEIYLSSQASFVELKKRLSERTGLHPLDQKLVFKDKERESSAYLDTSGVKDGSKMVLLEDPAAQAKRLLETRRQAKIDKAAKSISSISLEVDRLASKVSALEAIVSRGGKVVESDVLNLIELLMTQLIKLDAVAVAAADGDAKLQRGMQVKRVQKYVETLDVIKFKNAMPGSNGQPHYSRQQPADVIKFKSAMPGSNGQIQPPSVVVTTKWETFDSLFSPTPAATSTSSAAPTPRFDWELF